MNAFAPSILGLVAVLWIAQPAAASSLHVNPILLELKSPQDIVPLELSNNSTDEILIDIKSLSWRLRHGQEILDPASELLVTPSIFRLKANERRTVRVGLLGDHKHPPRAEVSYRLFIDEMPVIQRPETLRLRMRISLPVFLLPPTPKGAALQPEIVRHGPGQISLRLQNSGDQRLRLYEIVAADALNRTTAQRINDYVLAGGWIERQIAVPAKHAHKVTILYQDPKYQRLQSIEMSLPDEPSKMAAGR